MSRILIIEDEVRISSFLERGMNSAGHQAFCVQDGAEGAAIARDDSFDLVILDLGLPTLDGLSVLRQIRARGERLPVIVLTARDDIGSTLSSFDGGASDYVTKPFVFDELLARVNVRLADARAGGTNEPQILRVGDAELNARHRTLTVGDKVAELSSREFDLALTLFENAGQVLSREQLLSRVWGYDFDPGSNIVDVYVGYLRKKLGPGAIETVRGAGYRLRTRSDS